MALQPPQFDAVQAQALYALMNLEQAVQAADGRVQQATDQAFRRMQEALNQREVNNRTLLERNAALNTENLALNNRLRELTLAKETQVKALEEQNKALSSQLQETQERMAKLEPIIELVKGMINYQQQISAVCPWYNDFGIWELENRKRELIQKASSLLNQ